jgi:anthranilate phosphoribosyltransferase
LNRYFGKNSIIIRTYFNCYGNRLVEINGDELTESRVSPADFGLENFPLDAIKGVEPI